jgi:hypothetical protein
MRVNAGMCMKSISGSILWGNDGSLWASALGKINQFKNIQKKKLLYVQIIFFCEQQNHFIILKPYGKTYL